MSQTATILVIDDEPQIRKFLRISLASQGYKVIEAGTGTTTITTRLSNPAALAEMVVVLRGDTLWSIAADHLAAGAPDSEIAAAWPQWYAANAAVIGPDPNLLRPGVELTIPGKR